MARSYGSILRRHRLDAGKTLGQVARLLEISTVYVSDVERENRRPFSRERTIRICEFLKVDPTGLLRAADRERGVIEYEIADGRPLEAEVVGGLVTGLARGGVTNDQLHEIQNILRKKGGSR